MNWHAIRAIYRFEMARTFRTITQSIASPVLSTSLYFVVFGAAIGSRMGAIDGISYGAFIIPGLIMLSLLNESISNASFGIYMPKWSGTIYELLSAPVSWAEAVLGYVGAAASKSVLVMRPPFPLVYRGSGNAQGGRSLKNCRATPAVFRFSRECPLDRWILSACMGLKGYKCIPSGRRGWGSRKPLMGREEKR